MKITLKGKEYKLNFGIGFIHTLDEMVRKGDEVTDFGTGVNTIWLQSQNSNPYPLYLAIKAALKNQVDFTEDDFDEWVDSLESGKAYAAFFREFLKTLETQRQTGNIIKTYKSNLRKLTKMAEKEQQEKTQEKPTKA